MPSRYRSVRDAEHIGSVSMPVSLCAQNPVMARTIQFGSTDKTSDSFAGSMVAYQKSGAYMYRRTIEQSEAVTYGRKLYSGIIIGRCTRS